GGSRADRRGVVSSGGRRRRETAGMVGRGRTVRSASMMGGAMWPDDRAAVDKSRRGGNGGVRVPPRRDGSESSVGTIRQRQEPRRWGEDSGRLSPHHMDKFNYSRN